MGIRFAEPVTMKETLGAAMLLVDTIGEDELARGVDIYAGRIETTLRPYYHRNVIESHAELVGRAKEILEDVIVSNRQYVNRQKMRHQPANDMTFIRGKIGNVTIILNYLVAHEHDNYKGEMHNGKPRWRCGGCRDLLTITESRAIGLLPKLVRKRSAPVPF